MPKLPQQRWPWSELLIIVLLLSFIVLLTSLKSYAIGSAEMNISDPNPGLDGKHHRKFRILPAAIETAGILAIEIAWYEWQIELNKQDYDFPRTWAGQKRRWNHLYGVRFDDNEFAINMGHAYYNGSYYYDVARVLGASFFESWLFTLATSSVWEATVEHREVFSLNDTIVTPVGGAAIGEAFYQLGAFFSRSSPNIANKILMTLFSPAHTFNEIAGITQPKSATAVTTLGFPSDVSHRFVLSMSGGTTTRTSLDHEQSNELELRFETELRTIPEYGTIGEVSRTLSGGGELSRILLLYSQGSEGLNDLRVYTQASIFGRYNQNVKDKSDNLVGQSLFLGVATAFDLSIARTPLFQDFIGIMHVLGPSVDTNVYIGETNVHATLDGFIDFAMPRSMAINSLGTMSTANSTTKSILEEEKYTYSWGYSSMARIEVAWRGLHLGGTFEYNWFDSIEGRDRHQEEYTSENGYYHPGITNDFNVRDGRILATIFCMWQPTDSPFTLRIGHEYWERVGHAAGVTEWRYDRRLNLGIAVII